MKASVKKEMVQALHDDVYDMTDDGLYFPRQGILVQGVYFDKINDGEWQETKNLIVTEGLAYILNVALGSTAKPTAYYLTLFAGSTAPTAAWTAATFPSVATEIVSTTEGYSNSTRPVWTPATTTTGSIDNTASTAALTMVTSSTLTVTGAALLTNSTRGGTSGALISATKFSTERIFQSGDTYQLGYKLQLSV